MSSSGGLSIPLPDGTPLAIREVETQGYLIAISDGGITVLNASGGQYSPRSLRAESPVADMSREQLEALALRVVEDWEDFAEDHPPFEGGEASPSVSELRRRHASRG